MPAVHRREFEAAESNYVEDLKEHAERKKILEYALTSGMRHDALVESPPHARDERKRRNNGALRARCYERIALLFSRKPSRLGSGVWTFLECFWCGE